MKALPRISVIIPIYNVEEFLTKCIKSVINQTYKNLEIILVDDGSPDKSGEICDQFALEDSRIKVIHKKNGGVSSARNVGLKVTKGDYVCFIDPDDWIDKDTLELCIKYILIYKSDLCFFDYEMVYKHGNVSYKTSIPGTETYFQDLDNLETLSKYMYWTGIWNFLCKTTVLKNLRFSEELWIGEDTVFKFQLYKSLSNFCCLRRRFYHYRVRSNSCTGLVHHNLPEIIYKRYRMMNKMIEEGGYPENAEIVINSIELMRQFPNIIEIAFDKKFSFKCNYDLVCKYIYSEEFQLAYRRYSKKMVGKFANFCLLLRKPNRFYLTVLYLLRISKKRFLKKEGF